MTRDKKEESNSPAYSRGERIRYGIFIAFTVFCSLLPLSWLRAIGKALGHLYYKTDNKRVNITRINIKLCYPELSEQQCERIVHDSFLHAGMWVFESAAIWRWNSEKVLGLLNQVNPELLRDALSLERGVIVAVPHMGNWEVFGPLLALFEEPAYFYQPDKKNPLIGEFIKRNREKNNALLAPADLTGIRMLLKHLKAKKLVGMLPDHTPTEDMGVFVPFMGQTCLTGTLISQLAKKNKVPVVMATAIRTKKGFDVHWIPVLDQHNDNPEIAATALNDATAQIINFSPAQFQWVYPRFSKQPNKSTASPYQLYFDQIKK